MYANIEHELRLYREYANQLSKGNPMTALTIEITDDRMEQLKEKAAKLGITPEELVRAGIEELLMQSDMSLKAAIDHVLTKNTELYRRLS